MFKKVVTSVKTAWNTAVEEFEQDRSNSSKVLDDITNNIADEQQEQQHHQIHRRYGSRHNLLKRKATLNSDLENLSLGGKQQHKRRRFFSDLKKSVSREALSRRNSLSISAALPAARVSDPDLADEVGSVTTTVAASTAPDLSSLSSASSSTVEELKIRIYELETLVAQKDHIIKILREELTNQRPKTSGASVALAAVTEAGDQGGSITNNNTNNNNKDDDNDNNNNNHSRLNKSATTVNGFNTITNNSTMTPPRNFRQNRPMSNVSVDGRFDRIIDRSYYNHPITATTSITSAVTPGPRILSRRPDVSFEVLSPIAIDLDKFISTNDPRSVRAASAVAGSAAPIEQESQGRPMGNH
jgi:uncharacterized coiled-coil protein SlyX